MKIVKSAVTTSNCFIYQNPAGLAQGQYTISAYISTDGATLSGSGVRVSADVYTNNSYSAGTASSLVTHTESGEWIRVQATVNVPAGATHILAGIFLAKDTIGTVYVDDIQLEHNLSGGAGSFNQLANASLLNSFSGWSGAGNFSSGSRSDGAPLCLKYVANVNGSATASRELYQTVELDGKKGDVFIAGAWGKANSVPVYSLTKDANGETVQYDTEYYKKKGRPEFGLHVEFYNGNTKVGDTFDFQFNSMIESWQFLSEKIIAPDNYTEVKFSFVYAYNTGSASVATPFLYKENYGQSYVYDENGNVVSSKDKAETESAFAYQDNTLTESLSPTGTRYMYANDDTTQNTKYAISNSGQKVNLGYNQSGDATSMSITSLDFIPSLVGENNQNLSDVDCYIVNAKNGRVLKPHDDANGNLIYAKYLEGETDEKWKLIYLSNHTYYIKSLALDGSGITTDSSGTLLQLDTITYNNVTWVPPVSFKFRFESNGDGTFKIATGASGNSKYLYQTDNLHYDGSNTYAVSTAEYDENDPAFKWYLVSVAGDNPKMQTSATYDEDGSHLKTSTDADGNVTSYDYGQNGLVDTVTLKDEDNNALSSTSYTYDNMNRTTAVESGTSNVSYTYVQDLLNQISIDTGALVYEFEYDGYGRKTETKVGKKPETANPEQYTPITEYYTLAEYIYTDNLLIQQKYGTGETNYIDFTYDNLDRLVKKTYNGDNSKYVEYFYDPNGNQYKVKDGIWGKVTTFDYDLSGRINAVSVFDTSSMIMRALETIRYNDGKNTVKSMSHSMFDASGTLIKSMEYSYTYGDPSKGQMPDMLYSMVAGGRIFSFEYDNLGRLTKRTLGTSGDDITEEY
ncbi:MAG: RICIN domain-containing protein, partial [Clostridia bacterium]|nr:RICIN domain-containing protein [Clostridia bacterium]